MPNTYTAQNGYDLASVWAKSVPIPSAQQIIIADMVSAEMWYAYPWHISITTIASTLLPLSDGVQDYATPSNFFRLMTGHLLRTDTTPDEVMDLDVVQNLAIDLKSKSIYSIRSIANQRGVGMLRLESAVNVPSGMTAYIGGTYQSHHTKITALSQSLWFDDKFLKVFADGLLYYIYKSADDSRAGGLVKVEDGKEQYVGQYAQFRSGISQMAVAEDFGSIDSLFPSEPIGWGKDYGAGFNILGW